MLAGETQRAEFQLVPPVGWGARCKEGGRTGRAGAGHCGGEGGGPTQQCHKAKVPASAAPHSARAQTAERTARRTHAKECVAQCSSAARAKNAERRKHCRMPHVVLPHGVWSQWL